MVLLDVAPIIGKVKRTEQVLIDRYRTQKSSIDLNNQVSNVNPDINTSAA